MTKKEIYDQLVYLTSELAKTNIAQKIFNFANDGDAVKTQEVIDNFPIEYPELNEKIISFGEKFNKLIIDGVTGCEGAVFGSKEDKENDIHVYDPDVIDALSFYALTIFAKIDDVYFFASEEDSTLSEEYLCDAIEKIGYKNLSEFVANYSCIDWVGENYEYATIGELLVAAFSGEFE